MKKIKTKIIATVLLTFISSSNKTVPITLTNQLKNLGEIKNEETQTLNTRIESTEENGIMKTFNWISPVEVINNTNASIIEVNGNTISYNPLDNTNNKSSSIEFSFNQEDLLINSKLGKNFKPTILGVFIYDNEELDGLKNSTTNVLNGIKFNNEQKTTNLNASININNYCYGNIDTEGREETLVNWTDETSAIRITINNLTKNRRTIIPFMFQSHNELGLKFTPTQIAEELNSIATIYQETYNNGYQLGYKTATNLKGDMNYNQIYDKGFQDGKNEGYYSIDQDALIKQGYDEGYKTGLNLGKNQGYNEGYAQAIEDKASPQSIIYGLFSAILGVPIETLNGLSGLAIWNVSLIGIMITFMFLALLLWLIRKLI